MSTDKIRIKGLDGIKISSNGTELHITFLTSHNKQLTLMVPGTEVENLTLQMMTFDRQALIKREIPRDPREPKPTVTIDAPPPIFFTHELQGVTRPDEGMLDLQIQDVSGREIQVVFNEAQVKYLFEIMLQLQNFDDGQPVH